MDLNEYLDMCKHIGLKPSDGIAVEIYTLWKKYKKLIKGE